MARFKLASRNAFTLIELLLAITIFAILIVSFYAAFSTGLQANLRGVNQFGSYQNARLALNKIAIDFQNALYSSELGLGGTASEIYFFITPESADPKNTAPIERVAYRYKKDVAGSSLMREEDPWAESLRKKVKKSQNSREMAYPLKEASFEYFHELKPEKEKESFLEPAGRKEKVYEWIPTWTKKDGFPLGIKVTLEYPEATFTRYIPSPLLYHEKVEKETGNGISNPEPWKARVR